MSPTIYEYNGIKLRFYSNDHEPVHVHAIYGNIKVKVEFKIVKGKVTKFVFKQISKEEMKPAQLKDTKKLVEKYSHIIIEDWIDFYVNKKPVKTKKITKKL